MSYRRDIDGLRAIAILGVVAFHLDPDWLGGGYVGVDVFFVISGFLITRQVFSALLDSSFSLGEFYARRLRRLFPAAFVITVLTAALAPFVLARSLLPELWGSGLYSTISLANVYFWKHTSYFDGAALTKPLLHMWSLGVEEQFYLFWPGLLVLLARFTPKRYVVPSTIGCVLLLGGLSLWRAQVAVSAAATEAFYFTHLRAWEFAVGALTAFLLQGRTLRPVVRHVSFVLGALALGWSGVIYASDTAFPGLSALPPCLGAALLIASDQPRYFKWLLENPLCVGLGKISYSVYLVHWPLLVFATSYSTVPLTWQQSLGVGVVSILLGAVSWKFVEERFRRSSKDGRGLSARGFALVCAGLALAGVAVSGTLWANPLADSGHATRRNQRMAAFLKAQNELANTFNSRDECYVSKDQKYSAKRCLHATAATDGGKSEVLVVGDSLAANLYSGMPGYWADEVSVDLAASPSCRPIPSATMDSVACRSVVKTIFEEADLSHYELVILHGNLIKAHHIDAIPVAAEKLRQRGARSILLLGPNVEYAVSVLDMISKYEDEPHEVLTGVLTAQIENGNFRQQARMKRAAADAKIRYVSLLQLRCPTGKPQSCAHTMGAWGDPITRDNVHLSQTSAIWTLAQVERHGSPWKGLLK